MDWNDIEGIIQPSVVPLGKKHLRLYARSTAKTARVCVADSYDDGVTWTQARPLEVPNPNSGIDAVALSDGRVVLVYNNTTSGRTPLNLAVSTTVSTSRCSHAGSVSGRVLLPGDYPDREWRPGDDLHLEPQDNRTCSLSSGGCS